MKAERLAVIAEAHYQAAPEDEPPEAVSMAMPMPRSPVNTNAVSTTLIKKFLVGRPSDLMPSPVR